MARYRDLAGQLSPYTAHTLPAIVFPNVGNLTAWLVVVGDCIYTSPEKVKKKIKGRVTEGETGRSSLY